MFNKAELNVQIKKMLFRCLFKCEFHVPFQVDFISIAHLKQPQDWPKCFTKETASALLMEYMPQNVESEDSNLILMLC